MNTAVAATPSDIEVAAASGIGARITLSVMSDDYVNVILGALAAADSTGLELDTDKVSTFVRGREQRIAQYLRDLIAAAAQSGYHIVATVMLSRGCPGEVCGAMPPTTATPVTLASTGVQVQAQWSLYPLFDGGSSPIADHLAPVWAAIEQARERGTYLRGEHFSTTLAGDLSEVLATVVDTWQAVGEAVAHVATHVTISVNSPSVALR